MRQPLHLLQHKLNGSWYTLTPYPVPYLEACERLQFYRDYFQFNTFEYRIRPVN